MAHPSGSSSIGNPFIELQSVDSTNNYARSLIKQGQARHGTAIFAHEQLQGKGQRGKKWASHPGANLILSVIIEPKNVEITGPFQLISCIALAVRQFFSEHAGNSTFIKWPNDIYWNDQKAAGILIENIVSSQTDRSAGWKWAIVGIGININQTEFPPDLINPVSLKQITGKTYEPVSMARELCGQIETRLSIFSSRGFDTIHAQYNSVLYKKDQVIKLKKGNRLFDATLKFVSPSGKLVVQHGIEEEFGYEDVEWMVG